MNELPKNERVQECMTSEYPKNESTNEEARTTQNTQRVVAQREREREPKSEASKHPRTQESK